MNSQLTTEQKQFNDYLHANHSDLMKKASRAFNRYAKFYGGVYGYNFKGYSDFNNDIYTLARLFENDYADLMGVQQESVIS